MSLDGVSSIEQGMVAAAVAKARMQEQFKPASAPELTVPALEKAPDRNEVIKQAVDRLYPDPDKAASVINGLGETVDKAWEGALVVYRTVDYALALVSNPDNFKEDKYKSRGPLGLPAATFSSTIPDSLWAPNAAFTILGDPSGAYLNDRARYYEWYGGNKPDMEKVFNALRSARSQATSYLGQVASEMGGTVTPVELMYATNYALAKDSQMRNPEKPKEEIQDYGLAGDRRIQVQMAVDKLWRQAQGEPKKYQ